ncbi:MAG: chemotaxis protein CheW [Treponema sp.]|jgi:purine-binding chemotaxis protein CheW|nr:chemotaxis protein CheW [Treponema sp.]
MAEETAEKPATVEKFLVFTIRGRLYALPSKVINEVAGLDRVFPLPLVPAYVRGIINRYTAPYALVDICFLLYKESSSAQKVIVIKEEIDKLAFLIDDVTDIADVPAEMLLKIDREETAAVSSFFEWKGAQVFCLELEEIIKTIRNDFDN